MLKQILNKVVQKRRKKTFEVCGHNVRVGSNCNFQGHIECGDNVSIGNGAYFVSTRANLKIGSNILFGPNVTIYTGDHPIHVIGKHISDITDADKDHLGNTFDKDVVIEDGCWIGTHAIILKGVTIGKGCVIGAGAVVTKDVPPYSVYVGSPSLKVFPRFTVEEIQEHENRISSKELGKFAK